MHISWEDTVSSRGLLAPPTSLELTFLFRARGVAILHVYAAFFVLLEYF